MRYEYNEFDHSFEASGEYLNIVGSSTYLSCEVVFMFTTLVNFFKFIYCSWYDLICKIKSGRSKEFDGYGVYMFVGLPGRKKWM
jgi:hypothetical protein